MSKYPMSHVLLERKCPDTSVRITLVWVTGDTHPVVAFKEVHVRLVEFPKNLTLS